MRGSIAARLSIGFTIILLYMGAFAVATRLTLNRAQNTINTNTDKLLTAQTYMRYSAESYSLLKSYALTHDEESLQQLRSQFAIARYLANVQLDDLRTTNSYLFDLTENYFNKSYETAQDLIYEHDLSRDQAGWERSVSDRELIYLRAIDSYQDRSSRLMEAISDEFKLARQKAEEDYATITFWTVIVLLGGSVSSIFLGIMVSRSISVPIVALTKRIESMSTNETITRLHTDRSRSDVIGYLNAAFNGLAEQVTETREKLEAERDELEKANHIKDEFLSTISHELKTPLTCIKSYTQIVKDGLQGEVNQEQKASLTIIDDSTDSLLELINSILEISRFEAQKMPLKLITTDLLTLLDSVKLEFSSLMNRSGDTIEIVSDQTEYLSRVDQNRAKEVFRNIISNAIKYKKKDLPLRLAVSIQKAPKGKFVELAFEDNGIGIAKADQKQLFNKFYQVDQSMTRAAGGSGLGLAISKLIMESHHGKIKVTSEEGKGTTVSVYFPAAADL